MRHNQCTVHVAGNAGVKLLEQKVPLSYIRLQDVIATLAKERRHVHKDPVLYGNQYKHLVIEKMEEIYHCSFQDVTELTQATQFLHENGILLHYDDVNLQDYYFLDPQWLCDILANVVTIREINSLAKSGRHLYHTLLFTLPSFVNLFISIYCYYVLTTRNNTTLRSPKQQIWLRTALCGG